MKSEIPSTSSFDARNSEINQRYAGSLAPPDPNLAVCTVIIANAELDNNNIWRLLDSLLKQENSENHEILYVVNNIWSPTMHFHNDFRENQRTIQLGMLMDEGKLIFKEGGSSALQSFLLNASLKHSHNELEILTRAVVSDIRFHIIDASSPAQAIKKNEHVNPRGVARNIGGHIAYSRLEKAGIAADGIIDFVDGDCYFARNYVQSLVEAAGDSDTKVFIKPVISKNPELPNGIHRSNGSNQEKLLATIAYLRSSLINTRLRFLKHPAISGQQLIIRAGVFKDVGGYEEQAYQEDWEFAVKLDQAVSYRSHHKVLQNAVVFLSDRRRKGAIDGYMDTVVFQSIAAKDVMAKLLYLLEQNQQCENDPEYKRNRENYFREECKERRLVLARTERILAIALQGYSEVTKAGTFTKLFRKRQLFEEYILHNLSQTDQDYIQSNQVIIDCLLGLIDILYDDTSIVPKIKDCLEKLSQLVPEVFGTIPHVEPEYEAAYDQIKGGTNSYNFRDFIHIAQAAFVHGKN